MRRNRALLTEFDPFFEGYIHLAVQITCSSDAARGYFRKVGIIIEEGESDIKYSLLE